MESFRQFLVQGTKRSLLTLSALCLLSAPAAAQSVVVDGVGADERAALIDASRAAVEQVAGTFIDSRTLVENAAVKLDQIYTKAQGFVTGTEILAKEQQGGLVHLRARIDVDTDPDAQLMNNLSMIMMLNDPRIAVVVREAGGGHDRAAESALDDKLLDLGFSHVVASERTAGIDLSGLGSAASRTAAGQSPCYALAFKMPLSAASRTAAGQSLGADYLVLGRVQSQAVDISLPDGEGGSYRKTQLKSGHARLTVDVIRTATGEVVGTFTESAKGVGTSEAMAQAKAVEKASSKAAERIEEKFRHLGSEAGGHKW